MTLKKNGKSTKKDNSPSLSNDELTIALSKIGIGVSTGTATKKVAVAQQSVVNQNEDIVKERAIQVTEGKNNLIKEGITFRKPNSRSTGLFTFKAVSDPTVSLGKLSPEDKKRVDSFISKNQDSTWAKCPAVGLTLSMIDIEKSCPNAYRMLASMLQPVTVNVWEINSKTGKSELVEHQETMAFSYAKQVVSRIAFMVNTKDKSKFSFKIPEKSSAKAKSGAKEIFTMVKVSEEDIINAGKKGIGQLLDDIGLEILEKMLKKKGLKKECRTVSEHGIKILTKVLPAPSI
tara:strand:+ start:211 stop:1077 length:867 start_codon:yes stop_codon:yes gene_type:complete